MLSCILGDLAQMQKRDQRAGVSRLRIEILVIAEHQDVIVGEGIEFPESSAALNVYPVTVLKSSRNPALASVFLDAVTGPQGQAVLAAAGFERAP